MNAGQRNLKRRRQVFGAVLLTLAVILLVVAIWGHVRRLNYAAAVFAAVGIWIWSRRD